MNFHIRDMLCNLPLMLSALEHVAFYYLCKIRRFGCHVIVI